MGCTAQSGMPDTQLVHLLVTALTPDSDLSNTPQGEQGYKPSFSTS